MAIDAEYERIASLFFPDHLEARQRAERDGMRFAHYTSAAVAVNILRKKSVWMRNALTMNDFSEIQHGKNCVFPAYKDIDCQDTLKPFLNKIHPGFSDRLENVFNSWLPHFEQDTYIACMSEHSEREDLFGRLSMWRAYGQGSGVALILNNTPFLAQTDKLKVFSSPVMYLNQNQYIEKFKLIINTIMSRKNEIVQLSFDVLFNCIFLRLKNDILCTKHSGFSEKREWRIYYSPKVNESKIIDKDIEVIGGVPQFIYKIPLRNDPENGLYGADVNSILDRIIIGPSEQPLTMYKVFVSLLREAGVVDPEQRVVISDIPIRN